MKKNITLLLSFFLFASLFSQAQKNDSLTKKEHKFLLGITVAPNYSSRKYYPYDKAMYNHGFSLDWPEREKPALGCSILLTEKITLKRFMYTIGAGVGFYNYKGKYIDRYNERPTSHEFKHTFIGINAGYNVLLGKKKAWNLGITTDFSVILSLIQKIKSSNPGYSGYPGEIRQSLNFTKTEFVFWGGLELGRTIKAAKWLCMNISLNCKYSSKIDTNPVQAQIGVYGYYMALPRSLLVSSLNISFYPIFRQK